MRLNEKEKFGKEDEEEKRAEALIDLNISTCTATVAGQRGCINNHHRQKKTKVIFAKFPSQVPQVGWQTQLGTNVYRDAKSCRCCRYICAIFFSWC